MRLRWSTQEYAFGLGGYSTAGRGWSTSWSAGPAP